MRITKINDEILLKISIFALLDCIFFVFFLFVVFVEHFFFTKYLIALRKCKNETR